MVEQFHDTLPEEQMPRRGFHFLLAAAERVCFVRGAAFPALPAHWTPRWSLNPARLRPPEEGGSSGRQLLPHRTAWLDRRRAHGPRDTKTDVVVLVRRVVVVPVRGAQVVLGVVPVATADRAILGRFRTGCPMDGLTP